MDYHLMSLFNSCSSSTNFIIWKITDTRHFIVPTSHLRTELTTIMQIFLSWMSGRASNLVIKATINSAVSHRNIELAFGCGVCISGLLCSCCSAMLSASKINKMFWQNICNRHVMKVSRITYCNKNLMLYACFFHSILHFYQAQEREDIIYKTKNHWMSWICTFCVGKLLT